MKPTLGRIVRYVRQESPYSTPGVRPAIVVEVNEWDSVLTLCVFLPTGFEFAFGVPYYEHVDGAVLQPETWHWPKVQ